MITVAASVHAPAESSGGKPFSWSVGGCVLIAFTAFAVFHHDSLMPLPLGALFAVPWLIDFRKRTIPVAAQIVLRLVMFAAVGMYSRYVSADFRGVFVYSGWVQLFTRLCMVEVTLMHFGFEPYRKSSQAVPAAILMSALVFAAASKVVDVEAIFIYFAIPYFVCLAASLRGVRPRFGTPNLPWFVPKMWMHLAALMLALLCGVGFARYVGSHKRQLAPFFRIGPYLQTQAAQQTAATVGFNDAPVLGSTQNMTRSLERVLSIHGRLPDPHLRGLTFEGYSSGRWMPASTQRAVAPGSLDRGVGDERTEVTRLSDYISVLFVPLHASGVNCERPDLLECDAEHGYTLHAFAPAPFHYYFTTTATDDVQGPLCHELSAEHRRRCLYVPPEIDLRVSWLAKDMTRGCKTDLEKVRAIEGWLRSNIKYSLSTKAGGGDPITDFLLTRRAAHCEYFASAATILLRCVGVPARYVTGFYAHEKEGFETYVVRQQDSHAWSEAWISGTGWMTVEATPSTGMPESLSDKPPWWRAVYEWFADIFFELLHWFRARTLAQWIGMGTAALTLSVAIAVWRRRRLRARKQSGEFQYAMPDRGAAVLAARFDRFLSRRRIPCPPATTWQEHFEMLASADASIRFGVDVVRCQEFARKYSALRFGGDREVHLAVLAGELEALERA